MQHAVCTFRANGSEIETPAGSRIETKAESVPWRDWRPPWEDGGKGRESPCLPRDSPLSSNLAVKYLSICSKLPISVRYFAVEEVPSQNYNVARLHCHQRKEQAKAPSSISQAWVILPSAQDPAQSRPRWHKMTLPWPCLGRSCATVAGCPSQPLK